MTTGKDTHSKIAAVGGIIRERIVKGLCPPGARIPTWDAMSQEFGVSRPTIHRVIRELTADGFLAGKGAMGTYVTPFPPHAYQVGLAFRDQSENGLFERALAHSAQLLTQEGPSRFVPYFQFDLAWQRKLRRDIDRHLLAGLILVHIHPASARSCIVDEPDLPRVWIGGDPSIRQIPTVCVSIESFYRRAVEHLMKLGRRRIALLYSDAPHCDRELFPRLVQQHGLECNPLWLAPVGWRINPRTAAAMTRLMLSLPKESRPDALVIADDHLAAAALEGVMAAGVRVPDDLAIVAHANFPQLPETQLPLVRLGFDCVEILQKCLDLIERQRQGQHVELNTVVTVVSEEEAAGRVARSVAVS